MTDRTTDAALWAAVIQQARDDLADCEINSIEYGQAVAFFTHGGTWGESRAAIADYLAIHADDIERAGKRWIAARERADGRLPAPPRVRPVPAAPAPVVQAPVVPAQPALLYNAYGQLTRKRGANKNPFNPYRARAQADIDASEAH